MDYRSAGSVVPAGCHRMKRRLVAAPGSWLTAFFLRHVRHVSGSLPCLKGARADGDIWLGHGSEWCFNDNAQYPVFYRFGAREFRKGIR